MHKFNLIENANDSLNHAIKHMGPVHENGIGDWKRIIVDFSHVVELLFKEKLRRIHPAFVFSNVDTYPSSEAYTVSSKLAFKRLQKIGGLKFSKTDVEAVITARDKRNEIEHYEFEVKEHEAKVLVGQVLSFILRFSEEHLDLDWKSHYLQNRKWYLFHQYTEFYQSLLQQAQEKIETQKIYVIECTSCHSETFDIDEELCILCGHKEEVLECKWCSNLYLYSSVEYGEEAQLCPTCEYKEGCASTYEKY